MSADGPYMLAFEPCFGCGEVFGFDVDRVPSVLVPRRPLCRPCVELANPIRRARGLPEIPILPGAYGPEG